MTYTTSENKFNQIHLKHSDVIVAVGPRSYVQPTVLAQGNPAGEGGLSKPGGMNVNTPSVHLNSGTD